MMDDFVQFCEKELQADLASMSPEERVKFEGIMLATQQTIEILISKFKQYEKEHELRSH